MPGLQGPGHNNNMGLAIGPENVTWLNFKNYMMVDSHQLAARVGHQHTRRKVQHCLLQNNHMYIIDHNINTSICTCTMSCIHMIHMYCKSRMFRHLNIFGQPGLCEN